MTVPGPTRVICSEALVCGDTVAVGCKAVSFGRDQLFPKMEFYSEW
jgi:hypothetical protein